MEIATPESVGIFGILHAPGRLDLSGVRVATNRNMPVHIDGKPRTIGALQAGHVAAVIADGKDRNLHAERIDVWHVVSGPVDSRSDAKSVFIIAGQRVRVDPNTRGDRTIHPGDWVEVSGLREPDGTIVASRLDRRAAGLAIVSGRIERVGSGWKIGGLRVVVPPQARSDIADAQVVVTGNYEGGQLTARSMVVQRGLPFPPGPRRFLVQAYTRPDGRKLRVGQDLVAKNLANARAVPTHRPAVVELREDAGGQLGAIAIFANAVSSEGGNSEADAGSDVGASSAPAGGAATGNAAGAAASGGSIGGAGNGGNAGASGGSGNGPGSAGSGGGGNGGGNAGGGQGSGNSGGGNSGGGNGGGGHGGGGNGNGHGR